MMEKSIKKFILLALLFVTAWGCSQNQTDQPPTATDAPSQPQTSETKAAGLPTETKQSTNTPLPASATPQPSPSPTSETIVTGDPFPLLPAGSEIDLKLVDLITADFGWGIAPGQDGIYHILRTDDGGERWREITPPQPLTPYSFVIQPTVHFHDQEYGWASYSGTDLIWTTHNGGRTWQPFRLEYTATPDGGLIHSLDRDVVWYFQFVDGGMQKVYTVLYRSEDGGASWTKLLDPFSDSIIQSFDKTGVDFSNTQYGWLTRFFRGVTPRITLETTSDGGENWESLELPSPPSNSDPFTTCACGLYDPHLVSERSGSLRLTCECEPYDDPLIKSYLYQTSDGGETWQTTSIPEGELHYLAPGTYFVIGKEIYRTEDGGENWDFIKTVNWDGQLSFVNEQIALGIARCMEDDETALVKTTNGCQTFTLIEPTLLPSYTER
jgi:photosystem II stability/assembly factor-like uncharacterized protein